MADDQEFAAVGADEVVPELIIKEGEDIDFRVVLGFYLLADLGSPPAVRAQARAAAAARKHDAAVRAAGLPACSFGARLFPHISHIFLTSCARCCPPLVNSIRDLLCLRAGGRLLGGDPPLSAPDDLDGMEGTFRVRGVHAECAETRGRGASGTHDCMPPQGCLLRCI